jgi:acetyltransferase-like isoleucine patch superfamily enzyme
MAEGVTFVLGGNHRMDSASSFPLRLRLELAGRGNDGNPWSKGNIVIGSDVWLGVGALVLSGVTIGHGAVVAAGAVVVKDVPPYSLVAGNPARIVRMRFEEKTVKSLLRIAWWNWPQQKITREVAALCDMPAEQFAALFDPLGQDCSQ